MPVTSQIRVYTSDLERLNLLVRRYKRELGSRFTQADIIQTLLDKAFDNMKGTYGDNE